MGCAGFALHLGDAAMPEDEYQIIQNGPDSFLVEGYFRRDGQQQFVSASGFRTETEARKWVYEQQTRAGG
jgi:hypothetical protein